MKRPPPETSVTPAFLGIEGAMSVCEITSSRGAVLATEARRALRFRERLRGLLGTRALPPGHGLLIEPCSSIHTFFMAYPIDVLFLDHDGRVVRTIDSMAPWRATLPCLRARSVLELPAGTLRSTGTAPGDLLQIRDRDRLQRAAAIR